MSAATLLSFWAFALLFVITPGADWAYAIGAGIRGKGIVSAVLGLVAGYVVLTVIVAAGIGTLVAASPVLMMTLSILGAAYLGWLGIGMLRNPPVPHAAASQGPGSSRAHSFIKGTLVSGLNPKAFMFYLAFLPPWTSTAASWSIGVQILALGVVYTASCAVVYLMVGFGANATLRARPGAARTIGRISGAIMLVLATLLLHRMIAGQ